MTAVTTNYSFFEEQLSKVQIEVKNELGRDVENNELVIIDGLFGNVVDFEGIVDDARGLIDITTDRVISTTQIDTSDTFAVDDIVYFLSGKAAAAGKLIVTNDSGAVAVGICTKINNGTSVSLRPFAQNNGVVNAPKTIVHKITATAATAVPVGGLKEGDEIIDAFTICSGASTSGTLIVEDGAGNNITSAMTCAVVDALHRATTIDLTYSTLPATGAAIISVGGTAANTKGVVVITYIPA